MPAIVIYIKQLVREILKFQSRLAVENMTSFQQLDGDGLSDF